MDLRNSGLVNVVLGASAIAISMISYAAYSSSFQVLTPQILSFLSWISYVVYGTILVGMLAIGKGISEVGEALRPRMLSDSSLSSHLGTIFSVLSIRRYARIMIAASLAYGLFYALASGMLVYRPQVEFSKFYGATIPSSIMVTAYGQPGYIPVWVVYLTEHLGILIIPLNLLLAVGLSVLVGLNLSLSAYALKTRQAQFTSKWTIGTGALTGLFTGCPTCAGLFLYNLLQGVGITSLAVTLASYQPLLIAVTLPVLVAGIYIATRNIRRSNSHRQSAHCQV